MKKASVLRVLRVVTGWIVLAGFAAAGAGFAVPFLAKGAFVPALLGGGMIAAGIWLGAALLGGRWYCSCLKISLPKQLLRLSMLCLDRYPSCPLE